MPDFSLGGIAPVTLAALISVILSDLLSMDGGGDKESATGCDRSKLSCITSVS